MKRDASRFPTSHQVARRLLTREAMAGSETDPEIVGAALQVSCLRVTENLRDAMGRDGRNALLARALRRTEPDHPALQHIRRVDDGMIHLDGVVASVEAHGVAAVTVALEALFAALIDILGRLIGEAMAIRLVDPDAPRSRPGGGARAP